MTDMEPSALVFPATAKFLAWAAMALSLVLVSKRFGTTSYPFYFLVGAWFYLLVIPAATGTHDPIYAITGYPAERYYFSAMMYCLFYPFGIYLTSRAAFHSLVPGSEVTKVSARRNSKYKAAYWAFFVVAIALCVYSIATRNVFQRGGDLLFTILGFDFLLVCYLINRDRRHPLINIAFFIILSVLFLYAGFRYRLALLVLTEVVVYISGRGSVLIKGALLGGSIAMIFILAAIGQVRSYGSFETLGLLSQVEFNPLRLIASSGEQTLYFATVNVIEKMDQIETVGFQPITVLFTHFIPSAIFPDKPRAEYLGAYLGVTEGLEGSGAAMHDVAQATLMFGHWGLPFAAMLLGVLTGLILRLGLRLSPNRYYVCCLVLLFAIFVPSRGYLAQQVTWGLSFTLPLIMLNLASRITIRGRSSRARTT